MWQIFHSRYDKLLPPIWDWRKCTEIVRISHSMGNLSISENGNGHQPRKQWRSEKNKGNSYHLPGAIHIKDDILIHGVGKEHDTHLKRVCETLQRNGITVRPKKCHLGQPSVKWFGQIYSKKGVSPDPEKCRIIKNWPAPKNGSEVKSFLQTVQFNAKFMGGEAGESTYPELTAPLRNLTKKYARFRWGKTEEDAFEELKKRLCSDKVLVT